MTEYLENRPKVENAHTEIHELLYTELRSSYVAALAAGADPADLRARLAGRADRLLDMGGAPASSE